MGTHETSNDEDARDAKGCEKQPSDATCDASKAMAVYMVQLNQEGLNTQSWTPIFLSIHMPCTWGPIIIKENLGMEVQLRDEDTTMDENECSGSDMINAPATSSPKLMRGNTKKSRTGCTWDPKKAEVIISTEPREVSCNRCWMKGRECLP